MKSFLLSVLGFGAILIGSSCASVDPRNLPQTEYDTGSPYQYSTNDRAVVKSLVKSKKKSISIQVDTSPVADSGINTANVAINLNAALQSALDSLGYLRTVSANDDLLSFINSGYGGDVPADIPDYILLCRLTYVSSVKDSGVQTVGAATTAGLGVGTLASASNANRSAIPLAGTTAAAGIATATMIPRRVNVKAYFELYDREEGQTRFSKVVDKTESGVAESGVENAIQRLLSGAATEYMEQVAYKIGPIGIVIKTTAGGRYAYISLGEEAGLARDGRVQFLRKESSDLGDLAVTDYAVSEESSIQQQTSRIRLPLESVADGHVLKDILPEPTRAWIEVDHFDKTSPQVKRGMLVRLIPVQRKEGFLARFGL